MSLGVDADVRAEAVRLWSRGVPRKVIEERFGVSRVSVWRWSKVEQVEPPVKRRAGALTVEDREAILVGLATGKSCAAVAREIGKDASTVTREVAANGGPGGYSAVEGEQRARRCARRPRQRWWLERPELWELIEDQLRLYWSPEQISEWLALTFDNDPAWCVSHESIYQAIYVQGKARLKDELTKCLRTQRVKRRSQSRAVHRGGGIAGMVNISERPAEVEDRAVPGHWEGDLILGKGARSAVATVVERSTRYGMLIKLEAKTATHVADRIRDEIGRLPHELTKSLTWDQGTELADHVRFSFETKIDVYFCDPRSPWQRGSNENWNGLVRQWLPKGTDLSVHSQAELDEIARLLNERPRKTLNWQTPAVRFNELLTNAATT